MSGILFGMLRNKKEIGEKFFSSKKTEKSVDAAASVTVIDSKQLKIDLLLT